MSQMKKNHEAHKEHEENQALIGKLRGPGDPYGKDFVGRILCNVRVYSTRSIDFHTVKPMDDKLIASIAARFSWVFTVEEHSVYGGLSSAIAEVLAEIDAEKKQIRRFRRIGIYDHFGESGPAEELLSHCRLDPEGIAAAVRAGVQKP